MFKSITSKTHDGHESRETGGRRGAGDEGNEDEEGILDLPPAASLPISTVVSTVSATTDQFMFTPEFRRHFVEYVPGDTLMTLRLVTKGWKAAADAFIDKGVESSVILVHDGNVISEDVADILREKHKLVTRVIFLLDISQVGDAACQWAINLVVVDIPEGIESIGVNAFFQCSNLTTVSLPRTLTSIGECAFLDCRSLETVNLLHTNLQELGEYVFAQCIELKSMTIPDTLQTLGRNVFYNCSKLLPSNIDISWNNDDDPTSQVVAYLSSQQQTLKKHS